MKKNRFWYSAKQAAIDPDHICTVFNGTEWIEYSEWCSLPGSYCKWDDAVLVYQTDDEHPQIHVEGGIPSIEEVEMYDQYNEEDLL